MSMERINRSFLGDSLEKQSCLIIFFLPPANLKFSILDIAVQLPDKKSIIMYLTSLFEVLPKQVTMEDIREVETLPRRYKQECEGEFNIQQVCLYPYKCGRLLAIILNQTSSSLVLSAMYR